MHSIQRRIHHVSGFTLVELLVVIGVIAVLLALFVPRFAKTRADVRFLTNLSAIRQASVMVVGYTSDNRDFVPTVFPPIYVNPAQGDPFIQVEVRGAKIGGAWFLNGSSFHLSLSPVPSYASVRAIEAPRRAGVVRVDGTETAKMSDFAIVDAFYADPDYWTRDKQIGPPQWHAQKISDVAYPSQKAIMWQPILFGRSGFEYGFPSCCADGVRSPVVWADMSATDEVVGQLKWGVPNAWHYGLPEAPSANANWAPLLGTELGILGQDK